MKNLSAFLVGFMLAITVSAIADVASLPKVTNPRKATDQIVVYGNTVNGANPTGSGVNWAELTRQVVSGVNWQAVNTSTNDINWVTFPLSTQP